MKIKIINTNKFRPNSLVALDSNMSATGFMAATPPSGGWPNNEPAGRGLLPLVQADGSTKYYFAPATNVVIGAKWSDPTVYTQCNNNTRVASVPATGSKYGNVVRKFFLVGEANGFQGEYDQQGSPGFGSNSGYQELYIRMVVRFSSNWQWDNAHTQKLLYFATDRVNQPNSDGANANSFFFSIDPNQISFVNQANPVAATAHAAGDGTPYDLEYRYFPNSQTPHGPSIASLVTLNSFITAELWIKRNSAYNVADGAARILINGNEITSYMIGLQNGFNNSAYNGQSGLTNRIWLGDSVYFSSDLNFNNAQTFLYWGGSGSTKAVNDYVDLSELYISGKV